MVARRRDDRRQARAGAERAVPRRRPEATARRLHGHHAALRRRPPAVPHEPRGALPRGGRALQRRGHPRHGAGPLRRRVRGPARSRIGLPRPALRTAARRHLLREALPLPRGPGDLLARPGDHVGDPHAQAASSATRRSAQSAPSAARWTVCSSTSARRRRWSSPTAPTPTSTRPGSRRCCAATGARWSGSRSRIATRSGRIAPRIGVPRPSTCSSAANPPGLYSRRCRRW